MKKLIAILGLYFFLFIANQSCRPSHFLITNIRFESATLKDKDDEKQFNHYIPTATFTNDIVFILSYYYGDFVASAFHGFSSQCYAFTKGRVLDNQLLEDTYTISFDHPFTFNNITVKANQNIFEIASLKNEISIFDNVMVFDGMGADKVIEFSEKFIQNSIFSSDVYKVTFHCRTSDNKEFEKKIDVEFKLTK